MVPWLAQSQPFPPTSQALDRQSAAPGLLAASEHLSLDRLEQAYRNGVFPWFGAGQPVLWWAPDPRMVLKVDDFKPSRSLRKTLRRFAADPHSEIRIDHAFESVIRSCAGSTRKGQDGTWIVPAMVEAYEAWHRRGRVHSVETWVGGELAGGLYGVSIGRMFFGESMFTKRSDASKIALAALVAFCRTSGIWMIDCQQVTAHLARMGANPMSRCEFERHLRLAVHQTSPTDWTYHRSMWSALDAGIVVSDDLATAPRQTSTGA